tara:strand:- start:1895 stop:2065 length:171 start_codon:yes stop_codon:yes gene_type:complete
MTKIIAVLALFGLVGCIPKFTDIIESQVPDVEIPEVEIPAVEIPELKPQVSIPTTP